MAAPVTVSKWISHGAHSIQCGGTLDNTNKTIEVNISNSICNEYLDSCANEVLYDASVLQNSVYLNSHHDPTIKHFKIVKFQRLPDVSADIWRNWIRFWKKNGLTYCRAAWSARFPQLVPDWVTRWRDEILMKDTQILLSLKWICCFKDNSGVEEAFKDKAQSGDYHENVVQLYEKFCLDRFYKHLLMHIYATTEIHMLTSSQKNFLLDKGYCACLEISDADSGFDSMSCSNSEVRESPSDLSDEPPVLVDVAVETYSFSDSTCGKLVHIIKDSAKTAIIEPKEKFTFDIGCVEASDDSQKNCSLEGDSITVSKSDSMTVDGLMTVSEPGCAIVGHPTTVTKLDSFTMDDPMTVNKPVWTSVEGLPAVTKSVCTSMNDSTSVNKPDCNKVEDSIIVNKLVCTTVVDDPITENKPDTTSTVDNQEKEDIVQKVSKQLLLEKQSTNKKSGTEQNRKRTLREMNTTGALLSLLKKKLDVQHSTEPQQPAQYQLPHQENCIQNDFHNCNLVEGNTGNCTVTDTKFGNALLLTQSPIQNAMPHCELSSRSKTVEIENLIAKFIKCNNPNKYAMLAEDLPNDLMVTNNCLLPLCCVSDNKPDLSECQQKAYTEVAEICLQQNTERANLYKELMETDSNRSCCNISSLTPTTWSKPCVDVCLQYSPPSDDTLVQDVPCVSMITNSAAVENSYVDSVSSVDDVTAFSCEKPDGTNQNILWKALKKMFDLLLIVPQLQFKYLSTYLCQSLIDLIICPSLKDCNKLNEEPCTTCAGTSEVHAVVPDPEETLKPSSMKFPEFTETLQYLLDYPDDDINVKLGDGSELVKVTRMANSYRAPSLVVSAVRTAYFDWHDKKGLACNTVSKTWSGSEVLQLDDPSYLTKGEIIPGYNSELDANKDWIDFDYSTDCLQDTLALKSAKLPIPELPVLVSSECKAELFSGGEDEATRQSNNKLKCDKIEPSQRGIKRGLCSSDEDKEVVDGYDCEEMYEEEEEYCEGGEEYCGDGEEYYEGGVEYYEGREEYYEGSKEYHGVEDYYEGGEEYYEGCEEYYEGCEEYYEKGEGYCHDAEEYQNDEDYYNEEDAQYSNYVENYSDEVCNANNRGKCNGMDGDSKTVAESKKHAALLADNGSKIPVTGSLHCGRTRKHTRFGSAESDSKGRGDVAEISENEPSEVIVEPKAEGVCCVPTCVSQRDQIESVSMSDNRQLVCEKLNSVTKANINASAIDIITLSSNEECSSKSAQDHNIGVVPESQSINDTSVNLEVRTSDVKPLMTSCVDEAVISVGDIVNPDAITMSGMEKLESSNSFLKEDGDYYPKPRLHFFFDDDGNPLPKEENDRKLRENEAELEALRLRSLIHDYDSASDLSMESKEKFSRVSKQLFSDDSLNQTEPDEEGYADGRCQASTPTGKVLVTFESEETSYEEEYVNDSSFHYYSHAESYVGSSKSDADECSDDTSTSSETSQTSDVASSSSDCFVSKGGNTPMRPTRRVSDILQTLNEIDETGTPQERNKPPVRSCVSGRASTPIKKQRSKDIVAGRKGIRESFDGNISIISEESSGDVDQSNSEGSYDIRTDDFSVAKRNRKDTSIYSSEESNTSDMADNSSDVVDNTSDVVDNCESSSAVAQTSCSGESKYSSFVIKQISVGESVESPLKSESFSANRSTDASTNSSEESGSSSCTTGGSSDSASSCHGKLLCTSLDADCCKPNSLEVCTSLLRGFNESVVKAESSSCRINDSILELGNLYGKPVFMESNSLHSIRSHSLDKDTYDNKNEVADTILSERHEAAFGEGNPVLMPISESQDSSKCCRKRRRGKPRQNNRVKQQQQQDPASYSSNICSVNYEGFTENGVYNKSVIETVSASATDCCDNNKQDDLEDYIVVFDDDGNPQRIRKHEKDPYLEHQRNSKCNGDAENWNLQHNSFDEEPRFIRMKEPRVKLKDLPDGFPRGLSKFYARRYRLFLHFDKGIRLDHESWYSVTPEPLARHHAERCLFAARKVSSTVKDATNKSFHCKRTVAIDGFCGSGGNAIQLALKFDYVVAIDIDEDKLRDARYNASLYGVQGKIHFVCGDFFEVIKDLKADVVFLSPPWGGLRYTSDLVFDVLDMGGCLDGGRALTAARGAANNVVLYVPKNSDIKQLIELAEPFGYVDLEANYINWTKSSLTAYYGPELVSYRRKSRGECWGRDDC